MLQRGRVDCARVLLGVSRLLRESLKRVVLLHQQPRDALGPRQVERAQQRALLALHKLANTSAGSSVELAKLDDALVELTRWAPKSPTEHWELHVDSHAARGRYATALLALDDQLTKEGEKKAPSKAMVSKRIDLVEKLGWGHWVGLLKDRMHVHFPQKLPPPFAST